MYFVIDDLIRYFAMLKYGVSFILVFIGGELMMAGKYQLPDWIVCAVIVTVFNICIVLSIVRTLLLAKSSVGDSPPLDKLPVESRQTNMDDGAGLGEPFTKFPQKKISEQG